MLAYVKYVTCPKTQKTTWFNICLGVFTLAVLSKPMAVTFPAVLLIIDIYPLRRTALVPSSNQLIQQQAAYALIREKLPFFLLSIILVLITLHAQSGARVSIPLDLRILNAANSTMLYLNKLLLPLHFSPHYPHFVIEGESISPTNFIPLLGVLAITWASIVAWTKGHHAWLTGWVFYLVTLSPVLGIIQVGQQGAADRYAYFTTLPVYILAGAGILALLNKLSPTKRLIFVLAIFPVIFLLGTKTMQQIQVWKDPHSLWSHAIKNGLETSKAHHNLAIAQYHRQQFEEAVINFDKSLKMAPDPHSAMAWRGLSYIHLGEYEKALADYQDTRKLIVTEPGMRLDPQCNFFNNGWLYAQMGDMEKSAVYFEKVGDKSELLPNAKLWLVWLADQNQTTDRLPGFEDLPNFCHTIGIF